MKRESEATGAGSGRRESGESERFRSVKKEKEKEKGKEKKNKNVDGFVRPNEPPPTQEEEQGISDRRVLRSQYLALINKISGTLTHSLILSSSLCPLIDFACFVFELGFFLKL